MNFSDWAVPLLGGAMMGVAALTLLALQGKVAGISGIAGGLFGSKHGDRAWRIAFLAGLALAGWIGFALAPQAFGDGMIESTSVLALAGLLVGFGTSLGRGCTTGHGICGVARLSRRSLVATATFMLAGAVTVFMAPTLGGAS